MQRASSMSIAVPRTSDRSPQKASATLARPPSANAQSCAATVARLSRTGALEDWAGANSGTMPRMPAQTASFVSPGSGVPRPWTTTIPQFLLLYSGNDISANSSKLQWTNATHDTIDTWVTGSKLENPTDLDASTQRQIGPTCFGADSG